MIISVDLLLSIVQMTRQQSSKSSKYWLGRFKKMMSKQSNKLTSLNSINSTLLRNIKFSKVSWIKLSKQKTKLISKSKMLELWIFFWRNKQPITLSKHHLPRTLQLVSCTNSQSFKILNKPKRSNFARFAISQ